MKTHRDVRWGWCVVLAFAACGGGGHAVDAGADAGSDSAVDGGGGVDAASDARGPCPLACDLGQTCCYDDDGSPVCASLQNDEAHCGACGRRCADGRGTHCELGSCVCGFIEEGCEGSTRSTCCGIGDDAGVPYCISLETSGNDCGACGFECDLARSDRCVGGECVCGEGRDACSGAATSRCCPESAGRAACVDVTSDTRNCGACGVTCRVGEACDRGTCRTTATRCDVDCALGDVCCDGTCCPRLLCDREQCEVDAGGV